MYRDDFSQAMAGACDAWESAHSAMKKGMYRMLVSPRDRPPSPPVNEWHSALVREYLDAQTSFLSVMRACLLVFQATGTRSCERDKGELARLSSLTSIADTKKRANAMIETLTKSSYGARREDAKSARELYMVSEGEFFMRMVCALRGRGEGTEGEEWEAAEIWARGCVGEGPIIPRMRASLMLELNRKRGADRQRDSGWMYAPPVRSAD